MTVAIDPMRLEGAWRLGWALDFHTVSSEFTGYDEFGHPRFDTTRSELGELVYRLKYRDDDSAVEPIAATMAEFLGPKEKLLARTHAVVPVPASVQRARQPVRAIAERLGRLTSKACIPEAVSKTEDTPQLKNIDDVDERRELLEAVFRVDPAVVADRGILLVDDLYRSGATANALTLALYAGGAKRVYLLAATRTRSRR